MRVLRLHRGHDSQGLPDGEIVQETTVLEDDTHATRLNNLVRGGSQQLDGPGVGPGQAQDHVEGGGLACAIGSEEGDHLAGADGEIKVVNGDEVAEGLAQTAGTDRGGWCCASGRRPGCPGVSGGGDSADHGTRFMPAGCSRY